MVRKGMEAFGQGKVDESIRLFDDAADAGYPRALLWQRGLSLYYAKRFTDGATQFRKDVEMNPSDTEESIWAMLCEAQTLGFKEAQQSMLKVGEDSRPVMRNVYAMFRGGATEAEQKASLEKRASRGGSEQFYASLYLGLYAEAQGDEAEAARWLGRATSCNYGRTSGDYMAILANVHNKLRGWSRTDL